MERVTDSTDLPEHPVLALISMAEERPGLEPMSAAVEHDRILAEAEMARWSRVDDRG